MKLAPFALTLLLALPCLNRPASAQVASVQVPGARVARPQERGWVRSNVGGGGWFERVAVGPDGTVVACSDLGGAYISEDRGGHWREVGSAQGLTATHVACAAFDPSDATRLFLGTDDGIFQSTNRGRNVSRVLAGGYVEFLRFSETNAAIGFAAVHSAYDSTDGSVFKSTDGGLSWSRVDQGLPSGLRIIELLVGHGTSDEVYLLTGQGRFAGGPAGVYRSLDGGVTWTSVGAPLGTEVVDIALHVSQPGHLYASVNDADPFALGHLFESVDLGATWSQLSRRSGHIWTVPGAPHTLRMIHADLQYPWLPALEGIWESNQGGAAGSWSRVSSVTSWESGWSSAYWAHNATSASGAFAEDPTDPGRLYWVNGQFIFAADAGGASVSQLYTRRVAGAGGDTWRSRGIDNVVVTHLEVSAAQPNEMYATFFDLGLWRSLDGGRSWHNCNQPQATGEWNGAGGNTWTVVTDPALAGKVWAPQAESADGPSTLLRSQDAGATWSIVGTALPAAPILGLSLDRTSPVGNRRLFLSALGDIYRSTDDGSSWQRVVQDGGLRVTAVDPFNGALVYAAGENGFMRSEDGGNSWTEVGLPSMRGSISGLPSAWGWEGVYDIETDPHRAGWVYASVHKPGGGLYRSRDRGTTWDPVLRSDNFQRAARVDPDDPHTLYSASSSAFDSGGYDPGSSGVQVSHDDGFSWHPENDGLAWPFALDLTLRPGPSKTLFVASPGRGIARLRLK